MKISKMYFALVMMATFAASTLMAQDKKADDYNKVLNDRAAKIVNSLTLTDTMVAQRITVILVDQYRLLNQIHEGTDAAIKEVKSKTDLSKELQEAQIKSLKDEKLAKLYIQHFNFEAKLLSEVNNDVVDKVKDGMTYGILPRTYNAYLDMILTLKEEEKRFIMACLIEAREQAIDAGSSDEKHAIFGKYKGRLNNYLASRGYDLKKEGDDWNKRIKEAEAAKK